MKACIAIHGGTDENIQPAVTGMLDTLAAKKCAKKLSKDILSTKAALTNSLRADIVGSWSKEFTSSEANVLRSLNTYYSHNVLGKRKYMSLRKANNNVKYKNQKVTNYVPYGKLSEIVNEIDIGTLLPVSDFQCQNEDEHVTGMYRNPAEYIVRLAHFYIRVNDDRSDKLKSFENIPKKTEDSLLFAAVIGGDGAPICGMSTLISFLNIGNRLASSDEQFLLFGADIEESSYITSKFICKLVSDMNYLEDNIFSLQRKQNVVKVEFKFTELPNDMKMLAFLAGELSNSAFYFSSFANVTQADSNSYKKKFSKNGGGDWVPFNYNKRVSDAQKVTMKKKSLEKNKTSAATKRSKLTSYIANELASRQEFMPQMENFIDYAKAEPLHLKNNTVKERFMILFKICMAQSNVKDAKSFIDLPETCLFSKFVNFVKHDMNCNFLAKKLKTWYNENSGKGTEKDFSFRFRGKESFLYMKHFAGLILMILSNVKDEQVILRLHQIHFQSVHLRQLLSYSVRIEDFNEELLAHMNKVANLLFKACCVFDQKVSPSLWTLCNIAPYNAGECLDLYGFGLGCNTMEGR